MSPLKRVLLAIGALLFLMLGALLFSWHVQERALADALVTDITARLARPIERTPKPEAARHANGFACLADATAAAPKDLSPIDFGSTDAYHELLDAGVVPDTWAPKLAALEPWAESVRSCGDSTELAFVPPVTPFEFFDGSKGRDPTLIVNATARMTRLEVHALAREQKWEDIARKCAAMMEVALDSSHLNLLGAMVSGGVLHQLARPCGEALQRLPPEARPPVAQRFARLPSRLVSNSELIETERLLSSLNTFQRLLSDEQRAKLPAGEDWMAGVDDPLAKYGSPRLWSRWDRAMRQLVIAAGQGSTARADASRALDELFEQWWVASIFRLQPNYEKFFARNDETAVLLRLLVELAAGGELTPSPPVLVKTDEGLEFTRAGGEKLVIPLVH